jgi:ABC-2 type transport system permease protein
MIRAAVLIAAKDLRLRVRDRSAILLGIVAPFSLALLFSVMLGGGDGGFRADWAVVDLDGGDVAAALVDGTLAGMEEAGVISLARLTDAAAARDSVRVGGVDAAIIIPAGFSESATDGSGSRVDLIADPDATISSGVARSVLSGFASRLEAVGLAVATVLASGGSGSDDRSSEGLAALARAQPAPIVVAEDTAGDRTASVSTYYAAAMSIVFVFLAAQFGVVSLLTERRTGTLARMIAAPLRPVAILAGKTIVSMVLALTSMTVIVIGTTFLLGATWGDPLATALLILGAAVAATGIALLVVGLARTEDQAGSAVAIVTMLLAVLGGSFFPVSQGSGLLAQASLFTPHAWFLRGVNDVASGGDVGSAGGPILVLLAIGLICGTIGFWRARHVVVS